MGTSETAPEDFTLEQISKDHPRMWVAITVTKRDENGQPIAGKLIAEDADRYRLRDAIAKLNDVCIFLAGEPIYPLLL